MSNSDWKASGLDYREFLQLVEGEQWQRQVLWCTAEVFAYLETGNSEWCIQGLWHKQPYSLCLSDLEENYGAKESALGLLRGPLD